MLLPHVCAKFRGHHDILGLVPSCLRGSKIFFLWVYRVGSKIFSGGYFVDYSGIYKGRIRINKYRT